MPITELLEENARKYGNDVALVEVNPQVQETRRVLWKDYDLIQPTSSFWYRREITWHVFDEKANRFAQLLMSRGVKKGDKVAILLMNCLEWLPIYFGTLKTGALAVPMNFRYSAEEIEYCLDLAEADVLVFGPEFIGRIETIAESISKKRILFYVGGDCPSFAEDYDKLTSNCASISPGVPLTDEDDAAIYFSSGTTGFPKGVMLTHYNIANNGFLTGEHMKFTADDKLCCCVPLFHCFGVVLASMNVLTHGCTQVMVEKFDPLLVLASIHKERCTAVYGVPTMFIAELNHPMFDMFDMSSLRTGIMAGSLCPGELMKRVEEKMFMKVTSVYGLTEASPGMTASRIDDSFDVRCNTVGRDFEFTEVKVIDPETGEECPIGVQGEMCNKGYNTMKGYYKNPEATAEVIDRNGFLHSGDLGVKDEEGNYRITGRIKDMIIRGGENIYPREIEEFLYQMEGIKDVQVAGIPSKKYGEAVGAFIILHEGVEMNEFDIRDFCDGKIARYKIPKYIFFVDEFPMTGSGKIQKFKLKDVGLELCRKQGIEII